MLANDPVTQARLDLTAALRCAARHGLNEGVCNHFSMAVPGREDLFLVNPMGLHWSEVTPGDLVIADFDGNVVEGKYPVELSAFYIHGRIHQGNKRAQVVLHTHMPYATALTSVDGARLEPIHQNALRFVGRIAYDDNYGGLALDGEEGERLARALGDKRILFMANHGVVTTGSSVAAAFDDLYYLERACRNQVLALSTGRPLKRVPAEAALRTRAEFDRYEEQADLHFAALKRLLDREEPDYAE
jgi:ribulose-5-phosphate 4-epimerase/fuculose-1-phosphate aldolase